MFNFEEEVCAIRREYLKQFSEKVKAFFSAYFEENPDIKTIAWHQHTPYFNDGSPCEFEVQSIVATPMDYNPEEHCRTWDFYSEDDDDSVEVWKGSLYSMIMDHEDLFKEAFGDHKFIVVTRDGVHVTSYTDHE